MFNDYTIEQLIALRNFCAELAEHLPDIEQAADALMIIEYIDRELVQRERGKTA